METVRDLIHSCLAGVQQQPTKRQLLKLDSKLICQIVRDPSLCGLHVSYLVTAFEAVSPDWSTQDVIQQLVSPQTSHWRCRYVDTIDSAYVGKATYFVSHNLQAPFHQLIDALKRRFYTPDGQEKPDAAGAFIWIDAFAVNHHAIGFKEEFTRLNEVLTGCRSTLVVLDGKCRALSRLLLLYEIWATLQLAKESKTHEPRLEVLTTCVDPRYLRNEMLHLDVRNASLLRDCDKDWLLDQLMSRGVMRVNRMIKQGIADSARRLARSVWEELQESHGMDAAVAAAAVHDLHVCAMIIQLHGQYTDALVVYKQAIQLWEENVSMLREETPLTLLMHTTELLLLLKQWSEAEPLAQEALRLSLEEHVVMVSAKSRARITSMSGAHFSSEVYGVDRGGNAAAAKVPEPLELTLPPSVPCTILLARALMGMGETERAEALVRDVCQAHKESALKLPDKMQKTFQRDQRSRQRRLASGAHSARAMMALADILRLNDTGVQEATKLYFKAQRGLAKAMGDHHPDVAYVQMRIGQLLRNQQKLEQAQRMLQTVLSVYERSWGPGHPETASAMVYLADTELGMLQNKEFEFKDAELQSALQKATREYMQAFEIRKSCLGLNHPDTLATLSAAIVQLLNSSTTRVQLAKAEPMCGLAVKCSMAMQHAGTGPKRTDAAGQELSRKLTSNMVSCFTIMGMVLSTAGKAKDAIHVYEQGRDMAEEELPANHQLTAHCLLGLADLHQVEHDMVMAEALYRKALSIYIALLDASSHALPLGPAQTGPSLPKGLARISVGIARGLRRISLSNDPRASSLAHNDSLARSTGTFADLLSQGSQRSHAAQLLDVHSPKSFSAMQSPSTLGPATGPRHLRFPSRTMNAVGPDDGGTRSPAAWQPLIPNFATLSVVQEGQGPDSSGHMHATGSHTASQGSGAGDGTVRWRQVDQGRDSSTGGGAGASAGGGADVADWSGAASGRAGPVGEGAEEEQGTQLPEEAILLQSSPELQLPVSLVIETRAPSSRNTGTASAATSPRAQSSGGSPRSGGIGRGSRVVSGGDEKDPSGRDLSPTSRQFQDAFTRPQNMSRFYKPPPELLGHQSSAPSAVRHQRSTSNMEDKSGSLSGLLLPQTSATRPPTITTRVSATLSQQNSEVVPVPQAEQPAVPTRRSAEWAGMPAYGGGGDGRSSTLGRLAKRATAKLAGALSGTPRDLASMTLAAASVAASAAAAERMQTVADCVVQVPKLGDSCVSPHQLIVKLRGKLGRKQALLQQEAAAVANNLAMLLRWTGNVLESEAQLRAALFWTSPSHTSLLRRSLSKSQLGTQPLNDADLSSRVGSPHYVPHPMAPQAPHIQAPPVRLEAPSPTQLTSSDPHALHIRGLILSNQAGCFMSQGRFKEAEELYLQGAQLCRQVSRNSDAMIIGLNLVHMYWRQGDDERALGVARDLVGPHLSVTLGPDAGRQGGRLHQEAMREAVHVAGFSTSGAPPEQQQQAKPQPQFDLHRQIIEVLSERMVDDGGQVLYEWAAEAVTVHATAKARNPDRAVFPRLPETVFLIQVPGMHLKCVHMVRWLLVLDNKPPSAALCGTPHFGSHFGTAAGVSGRVSHSSAASQAPIGNGLGLTGQSAFVQASAGAAGQAAAATANSASNSTPSAVNIYSSSFYRTGTT